MMTTSVTADGVAMAPAVVVTGSMASGSAELRMAVDAASRACVIGEAAYQTATNSLRKYIPSPRVAGGRRDSRPEPGAQAAMFRRREP